MNSEKINTSGTRGVAREAVEACALVDFSRDPQRPAKSVRMLKQVVVLSSLAGIFFFLFSSSLAGRSEAAGSSTNIAASAADAASVSASQGKTKFDHAKHNQVKCDQCHIRKADATIPIMPGHPACISCHIKEFTSTQFLVCSNCHEGITAVQPPVVAFPERQSFGVEFSHRTHATYQAGEKRADCSSCHVVAGARTSFPAHRECYVCHMSPDQVRPGEKVGGASCGECHTTTGDKKPPSQMSKAYNYRFTHQVHAQREGIACTECHKVLGESAVQVGVPQLKEHRGGNFGSCGGCHNGKRAFGGELVNNACIRCHGRNMM